MPNLTEKTYLHIAKVRSFIRANGPSAASDIETVCELTRGQTNYVLFKTGYFEQPNKYGADWYNTKKSLPKGTMKKLNELK